MSNERKPALLRADEIRAREESGGHPWNPRSRVPGTRLGFATGPKPPGITLGNLMAGQESPPQQ